MSGQARAGNLLTLPAGYDHTVLDVVSVLGPVEVPKIDLGASFLRHFFEYQKRGPKRSVTRGCAGERGLGKGAVGPPKRVPVPVSVTVTVTNYRYRNRCRTRDGHGEPKTATENR